MSLFVVWCAIILVALVLYYRQLCSRFRERGLKYFTPLPLLGNMGLVTLKMEHLSERLRKLFDSFPEDRFVGTFEFTNPMVVVRDLELVKKITVKDYEHFLNHRTIVDEKIDPLWGRSIFSLKDDEWRDMRSTLSPAFTSSKIRLMIPFMEEVGDQMIKSLEKQIKESGTDSVEVEVKELTSRYANDVIASCAFGLKVDSHSQPDNEFYVMGGEATNFKFRQLFVFFAYGSFPKLMTKLGLSVFSKKTSDFFRALISGTMKEREAKNIVRPDMIHLLIEANKGKLSHDDKVKDTDAGFATVEESDVGKDKKKLVWAEDDLIAQTLIFLIGGFETTSSVMAMALAEIAVNPDVQERLVEEIKQFDAKNGGKFDFNDLQRMVYMDMVVSEVLRKWTPGFMVERLCLKDYNLGRPNKDSTQDYIIRKGEGIMIPVAGFHRCPDYFPNPEKFDPERFSEENKHNIIPFTYSPFGIGPRNCIGSRFAIMEIKAMLYQTLLKMEVTPSARTIIPLKLSKDSMNIRMEGGHWFKFEVRQ